jgi:hypothetical protein
MTLGLFIRDAGNVSREISELVIRDATNTPRTIAELWVRDTNNTPRLVFNPSGSATLSVEVAPSFVFGTSGSSIVTSDPCTATPSGGTAPYTYGWSLVTSDFVPAPSIDSPTADTTTFTQTGLGPGDSANASFTCTVTDDNGITITSTEVGATFYSS